MVGRVRPPSFAPEEVADIARAPRPRPIGGTDMSANSAQSAPNQSDDRRIGLAIRYVPTYVKQAVGATALTRIPNGASSLASWRVNPSTPALAQA